jgi:protein-disulfide isomerase
MKDKWMIVGITALVIGSGFWAAKYFYKAEESKSVSQQESTSFVRPHFPRMGNENSKVTIVEFLDPECESCRAVYPDVKAIVKEFDTKLVVRYAPFHHNSLFAIKILEGARKQNKYWETLDLLFETQPEWGSHHNPQPEIIWNHLPKLGLDVEKIRSEMNDPAVFDMVEIEKADGTKLGVRGTPTFFVNGKIVQEFGMEFLRDAVRREVEAAK